MEAVAAYERDLAAHLLRGLADLPGVTIHGITDPAHLDERVPTVSFTREGHTPALIAAHLARHNIFVWEGHYYALEVVRTLGLEERGGMLRVGLGHYNTVEEIDRMLDVLDAM